MNEFKRISAFFERDINDNDNGNNNALLVNCNHYLIKVLRKFILENTEDKIVIASSKKYKKIKSEYSDRIQIIPLKKVEKIFDLKGENETIWFFIDETEKIPVNLQDRLKDFISSAKENNIKATLYFNDFDTKKADITNFVLDLINLCGIVYSQI